MAAYDRQMTEALHAELDRIFAARNRDDMAPTIAAFETIYRKRPDDPRVQYELGGAYDTAGKEARAAELYERALEAGLTGDLRRRCLLQHGSTLRNLARFDESVEVLDRARAGYPDALSIAVFAALTRHAAGHTHTAFADLLEIVADHTDAADLDRYRPALRANAHYLRGLEGPQLDVSA